MTTTVPALTLCAFCNTNYANVDEDGLCDPCAAVYYDDVNTPRCATFGCGATLKLEEHEDGICSQCVEDERLVERLSAELDAQWQTTPSGILDRLIHKMMRNQ